MSPPAALLNSLKDVNGTTDRCSTPSQRCQCLLRTFRMFVVPLSGSIGSNSLKSTIPPLASILAARFLTDCINANCDDGIPQRAIVSSRTPFRPNVDLSTCAAFLAANAVLDRSNRHVVRKPVYRHISCVVARPVALPLTFAPYA
jgi:hypothetical protein